MDTSLVNLPSLVAAFLIGVIAAVTGFALHQRALRKMLSDLRIGLARTESSLEAERARNTWTDTAREQMKDAFRLLAVEELKANADDVKQLTKDELGTIVNPLKIELGKLDVHVRELESKREGAYAKLDTHIEGLTSLQNSLRDQVSALAQALRAPTLRGRWGEVQLRRVVELAGMQNHVDFDEQESGKSGRPDMIIRLPQGGIVPVDAKVSLAAFLEAMETSDEASRRNSLERHAQAVRGRIRDLSLRAYWEQFPTCPDVVVMFVPVEASLTAAFEVDRDLFEFAFENKVLVSSPIVLFALLKSIAFGWQQQEVAENAAKIAEQGQIFYERASTFVEHFNAIGKAIDSTVIKYNDAVGSFETRLLPSARRFKDLGVSNIPIGSPLEIEHPRTRSLPPTEGPDAPR